MNTGEEIHLTQDNRFMCKDDFLTHTKNFCKNLSGKNLTKKNYLSYYFFSSR
jgi:hypothetical protein